MAYLKSWGEISQMLDDIGAKKFNIARRRDADAQSNDNAFMYDSDKSLEENKQVAERILQRCAGEIMYMTVWRTDAARTGGCKYAILYDSAPIQLPQQQQQVAGGAGLYGVAGGGVNIDKLSADIEQRILNKYERERLERLEKDLREQKRALDQEKSSALGLLAGYLAPVAQQLAGKLNHLPRVAGVDAQQPVHAQVIKPISEHKPDEPEQEHNEPESGDDRSHDVRITEQSEASEQDVFTDEESDELFALMARFKAVEPQYMDLLRAVVEMAENGDGTYKMAKGFLLK